MGKPVWGFAGSGQRFFLEFLIAEFAEVFQVAALGFQVGVGGRVERELRLALRVVLP